MDEERVQQKGKPEETIQKKWLRLEERKLQPPAPTAKSSEFFCYANKKPYPCVVVGVIWKPQRPPGPDGLRMACKTIRKLLPVFRLKLEVAFQKQEEASVGHSDASMIRAILKRPLGPPHNNTSNTKVRTFQLLYSKPISDSYILSAVGWNVTKRCTPALKIH